MLKLEPKAQFWWGFLGGCIIVVHQLYVYASKLPFDAPWPHFGLKIFILIGLWASIPIISGFISRVCEPHYRLLAVFEGASAPAVFFLFAQGFQM